MGILNRREAVLLDVGGPLMLLTFGLFFIAVTTAVIALAFLAVFLIRRVRRKNLKIKNTEATGDGATKQ